MMSNEYAAIFGEPPQISQISPAIEDLQKFCTGITLGTQPIGRCDLERGCIVAHGQEFRVTLVRADNQYKLILLRAYIPLKDFPVLLDTYAEEMIECRDLAHLKKELTKFLRLQHIRDQISEWIR